MMNRSAESSPDHVFDRPLHLAGVLDNAADELDRTWFSYQWNDRTRCNCGIVARQVMQTSAVKLQRLLPPIYEHGVFRPTWKAMTEAYCSATGLSRNDVFSRLFSAGLRASDFSHLEDLADPKILSRMASLRRERKPVLRSRKSDVVAYLRGWALGIEEFHEEQASRPAPVIR